VTKRSEQEDQQAGLRSGLERKPSAEADEHDPANALERALDGWPAEHASTTCGQARVARQPNNPQSVEEQTGEQEARGSAVAARELGQ